MDFLRPTASTYQFYGRGMWGMLFFIFASCEPSTIRWQSARYIITVVESTGSRFLCCEPLIEMLTVRSISHIIIQNRWISRGLNEYPMVTNVDSVGEWTSNLTRLRTWRDVLRSINIRKFNQYFHILKYKQDLSNYFHVLYTLFFIFKCTVSQTKSMECRKTILYGIQLYFIFFWVHQQYHLSFYNTFNVWLWIVF